MFRSKRPVVALHDSLTAAQLVDPDLCHFKARCIRVDEKGASEQVSGSPELDAATDVDNANLRNHLMETWLARFPQ